MDPTVTWEIISLLSSSSSRPFFVQRSATAEINDDVDGAYDGEFFTACPIALVSVDNTTLDVGASTATDNANQYERGTSLPAIYSREAIMQEFIHVLQLHQSSRVSLSEMSIWLGMDEDKVSIVGEYLLCESISLDERLVCRVYNPRKQQYEYALIENITNSLRERINLHFCSSRMSGSVSSNDVSPSLEAISRQTLDNLSTSTLVSGITMKQLSQDMALSADDVKLLMDKVMSDDATISVKGESIYNTQVHQHHLKYLEKQIFSGLAGVTLPTKVCLSKQNLCIYIDEMSHTLTLPLQ